VADSDHSNKPRTPGRSPRRLFAWAELGCGVVGFAAGAAVLLHQLVHALQQKDDAADKVTAGDAVLSAVARYGALAALAVGGLAIVFGIRRLRRRRRRLATVSVFRLGLLLLVYGLSLGAAMIYFAVNEINRDLPQDLTMLLDYKPNRKSVVLSSDGQEIGAFSIENRRIVQLERMPPHVPAAFIAAEDRRFYQHKGFDPIGIVRAAAADWRSDRVKQGGSTITQQIIKQTLLAGDEDVPFASAYSADELAAEQKRLKRRRKMREIVSAVRLERELTKADILSIYLNHVYLGHGAYGVGAAAETYFGKEVEDLTIAEAAMLAGLVASPSKYAPHRNMAAARERQIRTLEFMQKEHFISDAEHRAALAEPIALVDESDLNHLASPYFVEHIRQLATKLYGNKDLFKGGLKFYSTLDTRMQAAAESALKKGLEALDRKLGFRGPIGSVPNGQRGAWSGGPAHPINGASDDVSALADRLLPDQTYGAMVVELPRSGIGATVDLGPKRLPLMETDARDVRAFKDAKTGNVVKLGDLLPVRLSADGKAAVLAQRPQLQGAMVVMEPSTGRVLALVGGYDWVASQFDRATQARRQVGSSIKPFIYSAALEAGKTPVEHMIDGPYSVQTATGVWTPANYDNKYLGDVTLMTALAFSLNTISVQLAVQVGLDRVIEIMRGYGITSPIPRHISISLGTPDLTLLELASAYAGIASGGRRVTPRFYDLVTDTKGNIVADLRNTPVGPQVVSPEVDYVMINMMKGVVSRGTARYALQLGRPIAGKTGTSANYRDVWFNGFTTDLLASVWIGRDDSTPIGDKITGGGAAVPIWLDFMQKAHPRTKVRDFPVPPNVTFARVEPWSGAPTYPNSDAVWMPFVRGTLPSQFLVPPAVRSFEALTPAPVVPVPHAPVKCASLTCL
jgi:penicillin-binding protein 1A